MLVLARKVNETIVIGDNIRITVVAVSGNATRLGIEAPPDVRVDRLEVHERRVASEQSETPDSAQVKK